MAAPQRDAGHLTTKDELRVLEVNELPDAVASSLGGGVEGVNMEIGIQSVCEVVKEAWKTVGAPLLLILCINLLLFSRRLQ